MKHFFLRQHKAAALVALSLATIGTAALLRNSRVTAAAAHTLAPAVTIANYSFHPATLTVKKGDIVTWVNADGDVHTIKSSDGPEAFGSAALDSGDRFKHTFQHTGTYHYICSVHPYMHGVIVVR